MLDFIVEEAVDAAETVVRALMVDRLKAAMSFLPDGGCWEARQSLPEPRRSWRSTGRPLRLII